jgi:hypothetical protein
MKAEKAGQFDVAYDLYCQAAAENPSSRAAAKGIARVATRAARCWENRARQAVRDEDHVTAWKHYMRSLIIWPENKSVVEQIRRLERDHTEAVADARFAWLREGEKTLLVAEPPPDKSLPGSPPGQAVASAERRPAAVPPARKTEPSPPPKKATPANPNPRPPMTGQLPVAKPPKARISYQRFLLTATISRDDKRHPKMVKALDGLYVKVRDTDPRPDADLVVYRGNIRVGEKKDMTVGDWIAAKGRSGQRYQIVVLAIADETETVLFGIRATK